ncbi:MAG: AsmA family protein [Hyphomicrobiales bacterium]|nr:AsmA family protein [Hyphomicrobiales bacterium]
MNRANRIAWTVALAACLAMLAAFAVPYIASTRVVSDRIADEMSEWSGFDVKIGAPPQIDIWPRLQANLTDVTLSLPGGGAAVVTAERVEIEMSALAALSGNPEFSTVRFVRPTISVDADDHLAGLGVNGKIGHAVATARVIVAENSANPDMARLAVQKFGTLEFSDGRIVAVSTGGEAELGSGLTGRLDWAVSNGRADASVTGVWRGEEVSVNASSPSPLLFLGGGTAPVAISMKSAPASLSFEGMASLAHSGYVEGSASFSAPSARKLFEWSGAQLAHSTAIGSIALESRIQGDRDRLRFEDATITMDGKPARGALDLLMKGKLPVVSGTLAFDTLDLRAFLSAFTPLDASADTGPGVIDASFASSLNLDLRLSAVQATAGAFSLSDVAATARVDEGLAAFDISDATAFGGTIQTGLRFDRKADATGVEMRLLATDVDGGALGAATGMTRLAPGGRGTISIILKSGGENWADLLGHANGSFAANFGRGLLSGVDVTGLIARLAEGQPFAFDAVATGVSPVDGFDVKAVLSDGTATIEKAELRTPLHRITFSGAASLSDGGIDLSATALPPLQAATGDDADGQATTFAIKGQWDAPSIVPTAGSAAN